MKENTNWVRRTTPAILALTVCLVAALGAMHSADAATPDAPKAAGKWVPPGCPPLAEQGTGPSKIKVTGPCAFEHKGKADCDAEGDDMYLTVARKGRNGSEVMLFVNVERYVGPGEYKAPNDVWVSLKTGDKIYRWWSNKLAVTVGPDSKYVTVNNALLDPELMLIGCTGPQTNYQCDGRSIDETQHMQTATTVTGTIYCKFDKKKN